MIVTAASTAPWTSRIGAATQYGQVGQWRAIRLSVAAERGNTELCRTLATTATFDPAGVGRVWDS